jgi:NADH-quinone oxidoreductase subunit J
VQILLYTGGVLTLVVFALVIAGGDAGGERWRKPVPAAALSTAVFVSLFAFVFRLPSPPPPSTLESGPKIGGLIFAPYLVPFELLSVLLLAAVFGALLIARKDRPA